MPLKVSILEFILRIIPEAFLIILAINLLSYKKIKPKEYVASSIFIAISAYLVRMLPIYYGVHTVINIIIYILIAVLVSKISIIKSISSVLKVIALICICEWINVLILDKVMKLDLQIIFNEPFKKILYSTPSLVMFAISILFFYKFWFKSRVELSNVCD